MRKNFKFFIFILIGLIFKGFNSSLVGAIVADDSTQNSEEKESEEANQEDIQIISPTTTGICTTLDDLMKKDEVKDIEAQIESLRSKRESDIKENRRFRDEGREQRRDQVQEYYSRVFLAFEAQADTEEKKQALIEFKDIINKAIEDWQQQIIQINNEYRKSFDGLVEEKNVLVESSISSYKKGIRDAFDKSKLECQGGMVEPQIRDNLKTRITAVKEVYKGSVVGLSNFENNLLSISQKRRNEIQTINENLHSELDKAKEILQIFN